MTDATKLAESLRAMRSSARTHYSGADKPPRWSVVLDDAWRGDLSDAADLIERMVAALNSVLESAAGQRVLANLADGIGTNTEDGRAWIRAAEICGKAVS